MVQDKVRELEELNTFNHDLRGQLQEVQGYLGAMESRLDSSRQGRQTMPLPSHRSSGSHRSDRTVARTDRSGSKSAMRATREASRAEREKNLSLRWRGDTPSTPI